MEKTHFSKLLLKTAFSCMACDGDIDNREIVLIKKIHQDNKIFGEIDINEELEALLSDINRDGKRFLLNFLNDLSVVDLNELEEMMLIKVAIDTIKADEKVEYSEIKFFKVIRSKLKIQNETILAVYPDFEEYLEQDIISDTYLRKLLDDFFDGNIIPQFDFLNPKNPDLSDLLDKKENI
jgi:hypothetical protein